MSTYTWKSGSSGTWSSTASWTPTASTGGPGSSTLTDATAVVVSQSGSKAYTVNFNNTGWYIGTLTLSANGSVALSSLSGLTANGAVSIGGTASLNDTGGGGATLAATQGLATSSGGGLNVSAASGTSTLSVTNGTTLGGTGTEGIAAGGTLSTDTLTISAGTLKQTAGQLSVTSSGSTALTLSGGNLTLAGGTDTVTGGLSISSSSSTFTLDSAGGTTFNAGGGISLTAGTITDADSATNVLQGAISGSGGTIAAALGVLDVQGSISGAETLTIASGAALELDGSSINSGSTVSFNSTTGGALQIGNGTTINDSGFAATISGLGTETASATSVAAGGGDNYINVQDSTITKVTAGSTNSNKFNGSTNTITLWNGSTKITTLTLGSSPTAGTYVDYGVGSAITGASSSGENIFLDSAICFVAGTRIQTDRGDVAIEDLAVGDQVVTLQDDEPVLYPVKWIGFRRLDLTKHPHPMTAAPVRIHRNAIGEDQPRRDLLVSADHSLFVDGRLIPTKLLINGTTIVQDRSAKSVVYYHVELDRHAILLAEGLPAESYLDTGNRAFFENAGLALVLHPEFEVNANLRCWEEDACAPLAVSPDVVGPIWHRLAERATALGYTAPAIETTRDADVRLIADGRALRPISVDHDRYVFMLPAGVTDLRLASRASMPLEVVPYHDDPRKLGVLVSRISIRSGASVHNVPLDHPALADGWHAVEHANGKTWRWTNGEGVLPMSASATPLIIELKIHQMDLYHVRGVATPARLAA